MYEALEPVTKDLTNLKATLESPTSEARVARISEAFNAVAQKLSDATQKTTVPAERTDLQKLYRGFVAAGRLVRQMHETRAQQQHQG